jgi:sulfite reductase (NADPH) hemoprotein beta-component
MYQYDHIDQALVDARVAEFKNQVERRLDGSLPEEEFRPLRLQNGLYLQRHAYMLRVAISYGILNAEQLEQLAMIASRYDRGYGHFTTRQNIQFNWLTPTHIACPMAKKDNSFHRRDTQIKAKIPMNK